MTDKDTELARLRAALADAERELAAMRQPITAEALRADGWFESWSLGEAACYLHEAISSLIEVSIDHGKVTVYANDAGMDDPRELPNVQNMHDLRELVRLLGGAK